jgi:hypothetical protein
VNAALYAHFTGRYAVLTELVHESEEAAAYAKARDAGDFDALGEVYPAAWTRRVDVLLVSKIERIAVEVKVTRSDFLTDVRDPAKQTTWRSLTHRHAFAVPAGLVRPEEVPADSGLLYVGEPKFGTVRCVSWEKRAPKGNAPPDLPTSVLWAIMHRCARAEAHAKGLLVSDGLDDQALRLELERTRRDLELTQQREHMQRNRAAAMQAALATRGYPPCATCSQPVKPKWTARRGTDWAHADHAHDVPCAARRAAAYAAENPRDLELPAAHRYTPPVEPADTALADTP